MLLGKLLPQGRRFLLWTRRGFLLLGSGFPEEVTGRHLGAGSHKSRGPLTRNRHGVFLAVLLGILTLPFEGTVRFRELSDVLSQGWVEISVL